MSDIYVVYTSAATGKAHMHYSCSVIKSLTLLSVEKCAHAVSETHLLYAHTANNSDYLKHCEQMHL